MKKVLLLSFLMISIATISHAQENGFMTVKYSENVSVLPSVKKNVIRLFPNPSYGKLSVMALSEEPVHFYVFDVEGTLVYQALLSNKEKKNFDILQKGTYTYDVFEKDLSIEEGKIVVK